MKKNSHLLTCLLSFVAVRCSLLLLCRSNNLNATLSNAAMVNALLSLHACGLTALNLEANNLAGSIPEAYSQLVNLKVLNLGEQQVAELTV
jgi:hypothetical protein